MTEPTPQKKSSFGCLKILLIVAGIIAVMVIIFAILVWQTISWFTNAAEPTMATYAPLTLSDGEKEDVNRVYTKLMTAQPNKALVDEYVTPEVFNGVVEKYIESLKTKNKSTANDKTIFRASFSGDDYEVKFTNSVNEAGSSTQKFVNIDMFFDCEMEDGKFKKLDVKQVVMHDRPVPFFARLYLSTITKALETTGKAPESATQPGQKNPMEDFKVIKLLKREGNKIHVILDGAKMKPPAPPAGSKSKTPAATKDDTEKPDTEKADEENSDEKMDEPKSEDEPKPKAKTKPKPKDE